jgi:antitoxin (DNA-binding transcriptional repressor) of toxin-antitoxin stability system
MAFSSRENRLASCELTRSVSFRVERGERVIVTRDGRAVAELRPLPRRSVGPVELIARRKRLPAVDPDTLRRDIDDVLNPSL